MSYNFEVLFARLFSHFGAVCGVLNSTFIMWRFTVSWTKAKNTVPVVGLLNTVGLHNLAYLLYLLTAWLMLTVHVCVLFAAISICASDFQLLLHICVYTRGCSEDNSTRTDEISQRQVGLCHKPALLDAAENISQLCLTLKNLSSDLTSFSVIRYCSVFDLCIRNKEHVRFTF